MANHDLIYSFIFKEKNAVESDIKLVRMLPPFSFEAAGVISVFLVCMGSP